MTTYRHISASPIGLIQQVAVQYVTHGYWFYVRGEVPLDKSPEQVDVKLLDQYGIAISRWARARRKKRGLANVHYIRFGRVFVMLATGGQHDFFQQESQSICDVRRKPLRLFGHSIGYRLGRDGKRHASVRIEASEYNQLKAWLEEIATRRSAKKVEQIFRSLGYARYAPVRSQLACLLRAVNRRRKKAGFELLDPSCVRIRRRVLRPFETSDVRSLVD